MYWTSSRLNPKKMTMATNKNFPKHPQKIHHAISEWMYLVESGEVVTCKDLNALSEAEIEFLNEDPERIVSVDHDLREVCFKIN